MAVTNIITEAGDLLITEDSLFEIITEQTPDTGGGGEVKLFVGTIRGVDTGSDLRGGGLF